jgi:hypothetical protein
MGPFNFEDGFFDKPKGWDKHHEEDKQRGNKGGEHDCSKCSPDIKKMCEALNIQSKLKGRNTSDSTGNAEKIAPEIDKMTSEFLFKVFKAGARSFQAFEKNGNQTPKEHLFGTKEGEWQIEMLTMFYKFTKMMLDK